MTGSFRSLHCCWFPPSRRPPFLPFPGTRGRTQGQGAAACRYVDQVIVWSGIEPGIVFAFPELWGLAGFEPTLSTIAWRTGGRTGVPVAALVADSGRLESTSGIPWVPAGWGNNRLRSWSSGYQSPVPPQWGTDPVHSDALQHHYSQKNPCCGRRHQTTAD